MRFITANQIFNGKDFLPPHSVIILNKNNTVEDLVHSQSIDSSRIEIFDGIISPGFINTHCHLELSHLKNQINQQTGIVEFALNVIKKRNTFSIEEQIDAMQEADLLMKKQGIVAVGDISNDVNSIEVKQKSNLYYHTFVELIGLNPLNADKIFEQGAKTLQHFSQTNLSASLAPHAPYSVSEKLIELIVKDCIESRMPTSIHNQESLAENIFFKSKSGDFLKLYKNLGIDIDYFKPTDLSSLQSVLNSFHQQVKTLLVHNTFSNEKDIEVANFFNKEIFWCLCPNANLYIENSLPNLDLLLTKNCQITLGTDSLASNSTLSILEEINTLMKNYPKVELDKILKMATYNGAKFLGIDHQFGLIEKGKKPGINLITNRQPNYSLTVIC